MTRTNTHPLLRLGLFGLAVALLAAWADPAAAAGCTDGSNCYCDTLSDPLLLVCEDFESPDYYLNTANDFAATTASGPAGLGNRGNVSRWFMNWANGVNGSLYHATDLLPRISPACTYPNCVGTREYCSPAQGNLVDGRGADCWGPGVNASAPIDIQRAGDINAEVSHLTLTGGTGSSSQIGAGNQHLAFRNAPSRAHGFVGNKIFNCGGGPCREIGVTQLAAYASNSMTSGIWNGPWKHEEWGESNAISFWSHGNTGAGGNEQLPYRPFLFMKSPYSTSVSGAVVSAAAVSRGLLTHSGVALQYAADPNYYSQSRDWPWGTWACSRAHIKGLGSTAGSIKIWHNETLIVDIANLDFTKINDQFFNYVGLNNFSNTNDAASGGTNPSDEVTYRYLDNFHVRNGTPVSCASIGFGATPGPGPTPSAPPAPNLLP